MRTVLPLLSLLAFGATPVKTPPARHPSMLPRNAELPPANYLSPTLRQVLRTRMGNHGMDMAQLTFAVVLLDREQAKGSAEHIATEPRLARPLPGGEDELNALLPERFFTFQDELKRRAGEVAQAAAHRNDTELGKAFGRLAETCVACHSVFLEGDKPEKAAP